MIKRVAILTDHTDPLTPVGGYEAGGDLVYILELSRGLSRLGWQVDIFSRWSRRSIAKTAKVADGVRVIRIKAGPREPVPRSQLMALMPEYVKNILAFQAENKLEYLLVHSNYFFSGWAGRELARQLSIPATLTVHSLGKARERAIDHEDPLLTKRIAVEKEILNDVYRVIATSQQMKEELQSDYGVSSKKITVIPGGVNLKRFQPVPQVLARRVLRWSPNRQIVLYVGRLDERKGIEVGLRAVARVATALGSARRTLRFYIIGGDPRKRGSEKNSMENAERERLTKLMRELKLEDVVRFVGGISREDLPYYYSAADVTIVPSYYEPFGLVPLESMACGTPVIASKVGGMQWTIKDGKTGFLVPVKNAIALGDKIVTVLTHPSYRKAIRENGLERVKNWFSWEMIAEQVSTAYMDMSLDYFYRRSRQKIGLESESKK